jgi:hypothetical protein
MAATPDYDPRIGPALTMLAAANEGNIATIYAALDVAGGQQLTDSCTELMRRMILNADLHAETDDLILIYRWATNERHTWRGAALRRVDLFPWSKARRYGVYFTSTILQHYIEQATPPDDYESRMPPGMRLSIGSLPALSQRSWALGLSYGMSIIAEAIADYEDADINERITAYRAQTATEMLVIKE